MVTGVRDRRLRMQHAERRVGLVGRYADEEFGQDGAERVQVGARTVEVLPRACSGAR
jgi:hypothetical protein